MKRNTTNPKIHTRQLSLSIPASMAKGLEQATVDNLISVADYCRLALRAALQRDGLYHPYEKAAAPSQSEAA
jgi:hypothetical protein